MAASDKLILVNDDYLTLETVYQGESLDVHFDLSDLFGETIAPGDYADVLVYLYHKFNKSDVGFSDLVSSWSKGAGTVTFTGDVAEITMTNDRLEDGLTNTYKYLIVLENIPTKTYRKVSGDCFILNYAADE